MKKTALAGIIIAGVAITGIVIGGVVIVSSCRHGYSTSIESSSDNEGRNVTTIKMINPGLSEEIQYTGTIRLNDEETAIDSISPEGFVKYTRNGMQFTAACNPMGEVVYELSDEGKKLELDERGRRFIAGAVKDMVANGLDATGRAERLYKKGGSQAVLREVANIKRDDLKMDYFDYLFGVDTLSRDEMTDIAKRIGSMGWSDFDKERLLGKFTAAQLKDPQTEQAWLGAVDNMGSDMQKENLLTQLIEKDSIPGDSFNKILDITDHIGSDMAKENVLRQLVDKDSVHRENQGKLLEVITHIGSDMAKENLFREMIGKGAVSGEGFTRLMTAMEYIGSDMAKENLLTQLIEKDVIPKDHFDEFLGMLDHLGGDVSKENVLSALIEKRAIPDDHFGQFLQEIDKIGSSNSKSNLFQKVIDGNISTEDQWVTLIDATGKLSFDNEKSNLLVEIAGKMPASEKLKTAYRRAAKTINSDTDYGRAAKALE